MEYQKPAVGISQTGEYGDSVFYAISCQCGSPECGLEFVVSVEATEWDVNVNTYFQLQTDRWPGLVASSAKYIDNSWLWSIDYELRRLINGLHNRISMTYQIWTTGYLKYSQTVIMSEQQALNYAGTLVSAIKDMKEIKQDQANRN